MDLSWEHVLPLVFMAVMGLALLAYVVLDGYDLGVGILLPFANDEQKDVMVSSIGPFWDANETWLVLGIGVLLIAFPAGPRHRAVGAVPAGGRDADRPDPARRLVRLPRQGARRAQGHLEPAVRARLADDGDGAGLDARQLPDGLRPRADGRCCSAWASH